MKLRSACLATALLFSSQALAGDWLDVRAEKVRILEAGSTFKEGQTVRFDCSWSISFADDHSYWSAAKTERFPIQLDADSQVLATDEGVVAQGTTLQMPDGGFSPALRGTSKPATWIAKGVGQHRLFCTVNKPKGISDQYAGNNVTYVDVTVMPEFEVQPGNSWPTKEPSALQGTARRPSSLGPASPKPPDGSHAAPPGSTPGRLPKSGGAEAPKALNPQPEVPSRPKALNPQPEVPSRPKALNPQPEVPSKPKAGDDPPKKKKSESNRKRPPPSP